MSENRTVLITCATLVDLAGAEVTTLELVETFASMGWLVTVGTFEIAAAMAETLVSLHARHLDLSDETALARKQQFQLGWFHHNVTAYRVLLDSGVKVKKAVFSSLSYFEPLEMFPVTALRMSRYLVNSEENLWYCQAAYPELSASLSVLPNSAPRRFWETQAQPHLSELRRLLVVSNHVPAELEGALGILRESGVVVDVFGIGFRRERVTPEILAQYDAVCTIGKTVQYALAMRLPVYCYDHFGGPGWMTVATFDKERAYNFSGRGGRGRLDAQSVAEELLRRYPSAVAQTEQLAEVSRQHFRLESNVSRIVDDLGPDHVVTGLSEADRQLLSSSCRLYIKAREISSNQEYAAALRDERIAALESRTRELARSLDLVSRENEAMVGASREVHEQLANVTAAYQQVLADRQRDAAAVAEAIALQTEDMERLSRELAQRDVAVKTLGRELSDQRALVEALQAELCQRTTLIDSLQVRLCDQTALVAGLSGQVADQQAEVERLITQERQLSQLLSDSTTTCARVENELQAVRRSYSWRWTRPARSVARAFVKQREAARVHWAWLTFLVQRSRAVVRHQGVRVFAQRALSYAKASFRRRVAVARATTSTAVDRSLEGDSEVLVTFVMPVYDRTDVLRVAIQSVLDQDVREIELVIVTDGSPPETMEVVSEFSGDPRVRHFHFPRSSGNAVRGRNKGILEARGRYVAFLDSDDVASRDRCSICLPLLERGEADVVYGAWQAIVDGTRHVEGIADGQVVFSPDADLSLHLEACVPCQSTVMVRRSILQRSGLVKPHMEYREDHELWARLAHRGAIFKSVPHVLAKLRLHSGNNELNFKSQDEHWREQMLKEYVLDGPRPKKIAFVLPGVGISGGIAVVFKHAALLMDAGHDAFVINAGEQRDASWFTANPVPIVHVSDRRAYLFEGLDVLIATGWSTAEWLERFPAKRKLYFVQSDERRFHEEPALRERIHQTYLTPCEYMTEALWIKELLHREFGHHADYVPNGLDLSMFHQDDPLEPRSPERLRVLLEGPIVIPFKGMADSYAAVEGLDCDIWIVSSAGRPPAHWKYERFFEAVPFGKMHQIYSSCDIMLKMSRVEGFFGPPMEAMACGCAPVVGKVTGYDEYIVDGVNALVVEAGDVSGARRAVMRLLGDKELRTAIVHGGQQTVPLWSWERSAEAMRRVVMKDPMPNRD